MLSSLLKLFKLPSQIKIDLSDKTFKDGQISWVMMFPDGNQAIVMLQELLITHHNNRLYISAVLHEKSIDITIDYDPDIDQVVIYEVISNIITAEKKIKEE